MTRSLRRSNFVVGFVREKQLVVLRVAVLVLLALHAVMLFRCHSSSCIVGNPVEQDLKWFYTAFVHNSTSQAGSSFRLDKGPFLTWKEAQIARTAILRRDIQTEVGAPLNPLYRRLRESPSRIKELSPPPSTCRQYYQEDSPIDIDLALTRMLGISTARIPTNLVRNVTVAVDLTTNYTTRFPLQKSVTIYVLKDGKLFFDRRTNHPRSCGHQHKVVGFLSFFQEAARFLGPEHTLPDVAFRYNCLDNPYPPLQGLWTYSSVKEGIGGPLAFPDDYFTFERWKRLRPDPSEPAYRDKPPQAAWYGGKTGDKPMHHAYRKGFLDVVDVDFLANTTSREYLVNMYRTGKDSRILAAFDKIPMAELLGRYRVVLAIAGHSFASSTLSLLSSNSLVVEQDYPVISWEDHFFFPGVHFLSIPRDMNDEVLQRILNLVEDPRNDDYFTNMTRLAATVTELVVDPTFTSCYTHRALQLWNSRMEPKASQLDEYMVEIVDFSAKSRPLTPKQLLTRAFHTRVYSGFLMSLWESALIWWWDIDYNATTYL